MASSGTFCTLNPLSTKGATLSRGDCRADSTFYWATYYGTIALPASGKWYAECRVPNIVAADASFPMGIQDAAELYYLGSKTSNGNPQYIGMQTATAGEGYSVYTHAGGSYSKKYHNNSHVDTSLASASGGDIYQIAVDLDNNKLWFGKNNTWDQSNPSTNGTATYNITNKSYVMGGSASSSEYHIWNFGQDSTFGGGVSAGGNADDNGFGDFKYAPPTGFLAVCSANVSIADAIDPAQTDDNYIGGKHFEAIKYTGNDGTNNITYGFKPDMVIHKMLGTTGGGYPAQLWDTSRGDDYYLYPSNTNQSAISGSDYLEFTSTGVKLDNSWDGLNHNGESYISFGWRANGGTTSSNTEGQTTSTVQANQDGGFSIVEYAGTLTSSGTKTIGHGLSKAPEFIIIKNPNKTGRWFVQHTGLTSWNYYLSTNTLTGETNSSGNGSMSAPTSDVFYTNWTEGSNESPYNHIAYCWHSVEGFSKFGSYSGSGSTDGTFIHTGFRPKCVWIKRKNTSSVTYGWPIFIDEVNDNLNKAEFKNFWLDTYAGAGNNYGLDFLSNGFKMRNSNTNLDGSGSTYIYCAWGDVPFKYNNAF